MHSIISPGTAASVIALILESLGLSRPIKINIRQLKYVCIVENDKERLLCVKTWSI